MSIITQESININNQIEQLYLQLLNQTIHNYDIINILILENTWTKPFNIDEIISKIEYIKDGSIVIYSFGIRIDEILPISNFDVKPDIIQYLKLKIPQILLCQWNKIKVEQAIQIINDYKCFECFINKNIILI
jgi:hypothetical protein